MDRYRKTSNDLSSLIELVIKAMVGIVVVYLVAKTLLGIIVGSEAANIISAVLGIAGLFVVIVSKRVRNEILSFGNSDGQSPNQPHNEQPPKQS